MAARDSQEFLKMGLTSAEARRRLAKDGPNEIDHKRRYSVVKLFFSQFASPLIYILVIAGIVTWWLGEYIDSGVIWAAVVVNTILGFWQEFKAAKSLEALRAFLNPKAKVIRDGERKKIALAEVVVGDLAVLESGESIPADGVVVEAKDLTVTEAILTGESVPVVKESYKLQGRAGTSYKNFDKLDGKYKTFMGTMAETGLGLMVVERVGQGTEMGKIATSLVDTKEEKTPLQQKVAGLSRTLAIVVFAAAIVIFLVGVYRGLGLVEMFETAVAVAVAAIPEGLVVALTVILALGMQRILKRKALVRKLVSAETLGGVSVICADKTGTLTEGKMRVVKAVTRLGQQVRGKQSEDIARAAVLCNDQRDPLELAMLAWAKNDLGKKYQGLTDQMKRLDEIPFSPERKYIATLHETRGIKGSKGRLVFLSGAPEVVMDRSRMSKSERAKWDKRLAELGDEGLRLVGFAYKSGVKKLKGGELAQMQWLGVLAFEDPVREGVSVSLRAARSAGIEVKVITGDYLNTALAVLKRLDIYKRKLEGEMIMNGEELGRLAPGELKQRVQKVALFVRTTPQQKLKIVEALQARGEVVAMTGDGVNDAPAIKRADIGIVVSEASDVSKETADMVLLDNNFKTIIESVREGRVIYETIRKVIVYLLASSFTEVILVGGGLLLGLPLPVTAVQILWVNLIEDSLPNLALAFERNEPGVMREKPRKRGASLLDKEMKIIIFVIGLVTDLFLLGLFLILHYRGLPLPIVQTFVFVGLGIDSLLYVFSVKTLRRNIWEENLLDNTFLLVAVAIGFAMLIPAVYWPPLQRILRTQALAAWAWGLLLTLGLVKVAGIELVKWAFLRKGIKGIDPSTS